MLLTVKETMEYLGLGENQVRELIRREPFGCRIGNRLYANRKLLDEWLVSRCRKKR